MEQHPLTEAGTTDFAEPRSWPTVVGTISIIWATLNMMCGLCGVLSPVMMSRFMKSAEAQLGPMPEVMKPGTAQIALAGMGFLWAILLLVAGIMLTLRKPIARPMHLVYSAGAIVLSIAATAAAIMAQLRIADWVASNPDNKWAQQQNSTMSFIVLGVAIVLGLAWPVFCLVWFGLVKRGTAEITGPDGSAG
jgi:hypothetical protein